VPDLIRTFHEKNKDINIELTQKTTQHILHDVLDGITDIGFCGEFKDDDEFSLISKEPIYNEEMILIVPDSHPLAQREQVSFEDIKDETFIGYNNSTGIVHTIYNGIAKKGYPDFKFKTAFKSNEGNNVTGLVRANLGIAFVVNNPSIYTGGVTVLKLSDLYFIRTIYMVWKKDIYLSPAAKAFRSFVLSNINEPSK
jgi:DNA-binding transcriptional LysR family regulator